MSAPTKLYTDGLCVKLARIAAEKKTLNFRQVKFLFPKRRIKTLRDAMQRAEDYGWIARTREAGKGRNAEPAEWKSISEPCRAPRVKPTYMPRVNSVFALGAALS